MRSLFSTLILTSTLVALTGCLKPSGGRTQVGPKVGAECSTEDISEEFSLAVAPQGTWKEVKAVITTNCKGCHATFTDYTIAKSKIKEMIRTTNLKTSNEDFMPQGKAKLVTADLKAMTLWQQNGMPKEGTGSDEREEEAEAPKPKSTKTPTPKAPAKTEC